VNKWADTFRSTFIFTKQRMTGVVVLLGWFGAQKKFVEKYSQIYSTLLPATWVTKVMIMPPDHMMYNFSSITKFAAKVVKEIEAAGKQDSYSGKTNVIFHLFSNGGTFPAAELVQLTEFKEKLDVKGWVFDSCPGGLTLETLIGALTDSFDPKLFNYVRKDFVKWLIFTLVILIGFPLIWFVNRPKWLISTEPYFEQVARDPHNAPLLLLYSDKDHLVKVQFVEQFEQIKRRISPCCAIEKVNFKDSDHVQHFRKHPELYRASIEKFLQDKCRLQMKTKE
jgi:hypothetical protein